MQRFIHTLLLGLMLAGSVSAYMIGRTSGPGIPRPARDRAIAWPKRDAGVVSARLADAARVNEAALASARPGRKAGAPESRGEPRDTGRDLVDDGSSAGAMMYEPSAMVLAALGLLALGAATRRPR